MPTWKDAKKRYVDLLRLYGHQELEISIERAGATGKRIPWKLDPTKTGQTKSLPVLEVGNATGPYTVTVKPTAPAPPGVVWRDAPSGGARPVLARSDPRDGRIPPRREDSQTSQSPATNFTGQARESDQRRSGRAVAVLPLNLPRTSRSLGPASPVERRARQRRGARSLSR
jgi:hypothetical protein